MSSFTQFTSFEKVPDTYKTYILTKDLIWDIGRYKSGWQLLLPSGFEFDISVPKCGEFILSPHDHRVLPCAAVHDFLLKNGFDQVFAASEMRRAMIAKGIDKNFSWFIFSSVFIYSILNVECLFYFDN